MDNVKNFILDRAQSRFDRFGYQKTTMDEISRDCKMSKRTLYEKFKDKQNLFDCLIEREGLKDLEIIFSRMGEVPDPLDRLMQLLRTAIAYFSEDIFLTRLLNNDEALFSTMMKCQSHLLITEQLIKIIAGIIAEGKEHGRIRADVDDQVTAYIGLRLFQAFSYMRTIQFDMKKEQQGFYTEALVDFFYNALVNK